MVSTLFRECLMDVYIAEHGGEAAFEVMLSHAENDEQRYILGTLLQAETEGKALMRPLISRLGLPLLDPGNTRAETAAATEPFKEVPWRERFVFLGEAVRTTYLPRYEELATLVSADEDAQAAKIAQFMGTHERALLALAVNVIDGVADPAAPVAAILHFPLARLA
ncbi:hypothetical protein [Sandarakinorhabdus oryzae]|uniref:hypothetical protein n=1 Tax=Sandarakinorhabdus oryzae TaxID=2675220 RepID=UPI0012E2D81D|nr:hypothetical protein [Sandarakinorhabdus oryzae]